MAILMIVLSILMIIGGISCIAAPVATFSALGWLAGISILTVGLSSILQYAAGDICSKRLVNQRIFR